MYEFFVIVGNNDVVDTLHHLERIGVVDSLLPCFEVAQALLQLYGHLSP